MSQFKVLKNIYNGNLSKIFYSKSEGKSIVVKQYFTKSDDSFLREKTILKKLNDNLIIKPTFFGKRCILVFDFVAKDLKFALENNLIANSIRNNIACQILEALKYLKNNLIVHFDLKTSNILLKDEKIKLIDFGSAKYHLESIITYDYTNQYCSLEYLLGYKKADFFKDVWSFGCIYYELIAKETLFKNTNSFGVISEILSIFGFPTDYNKIDTPHITMIDNNKILNNVFLERFGKVPVEYHNLFKMIFELNPNERIDASSTKILLETLINT